MIGRHSPFFFGARKNVEVKPMAVPDGRGRIVFVSRRERISFSKAALWFGFRGMGVTLKGGYEEGLLVNSSK
jgi:hypothetical protein